ncbi:MAG TPA: DUF5635 domain-containing protein [Kineosporiaceae bacterium]|nr:DUF5635 domain-containing protein [Kineosporiaceae bacterium]
MDEGVAVLNGITHRDWLQPEPTSVRWVDADSSLEVLSRGGFTGGVRPDNVLTTRYSRYPALADLFRALRLVDRQGVGVPRMYQTMIAEGHRIPLIELLPGPRVRTTLTGEPLLPVLAGLLAGIEPAVRRRDVRVAVLVDALLRHPYVTPATAARALQTSPARAELALDAAASCMVGRRPLTARLGDAWILDPQLASTAVSGALGEIPRSGELLWFRRRSAGTARAVATAWLAEHAKVTSGEVARMTGMAQPNVSTALSAAVGQSGGLARGEGKGRNAHFVPNTSVTPDASS